MSDNQREATSILNYAQAERRWISVLAAYRIKAAGILIALCTFAFGVIGMMGIGPLKPTLKTFMPQGVRNNQADIFIDPLASVEPLPVEYRLVREFINETGGTMLGDEQGGVASAEQMVTDMPLKAHGIDASTGATWFEFPQGKLEIKKHELIQFSPSHRRWTIEQLLPDVNGAPSRREVVVVYRNVNGIDTIRVERSANSRGTIIGYGERYAQHRAPSLLIAAWWVLLAGELVLLACCLISNEQRNRKRLELWVTGCALAMAIAWLVTGFSVEPRYWVVDISRPTGRGFLPLPLLLIPAIGACFWAAGMWIFSRCANR